MRRTHHLPSRLETFFAELAKRWNEYPALRAKLVEEPSAAEGVQVIDGELNKIARYNRRQQPRWMPFSTAMRMVPPGIISRGTAWCMCCDGIITSRQPGGMQTKIEVDIESFWREIERYAWKRGRKFVRPQ